MPIGPYDLLTAVSVVIPADSARHQLWPLIKAAAIAQNANANPSPTCREMKLQNDPDQNGGTGNGSVWIGGAFLTSVSGGEKLTFGGSSLVRGPHDENVSISTYYAYALTGPVTLNIMAERG